MRRSGAGVTGRSGAGLAALLALVAGAAGLAGCSTNHSQSTSSTNAPRGAVYRVGTTAVRIAFPGSPSVEDDPPPLVTLMPKHTVVTTWDIGDVGGFVDHSFELVMATFPPGSTTTTIDDFLSGYAEAPNSTMFGHPALHELSTIPFSAGTRYSGITAFNLGRVLVMAVGFDSVKAAVVGFLGSLQPVSAGG
jgi:hypothetical protein